MKVDQDSFLSPIGVHEKNCYILLLLVLFYKWTVGKIKSQPSPPVSVDGDVSWTCDIGPRSISSVQIFWCWARTWRDIPSFGRALWLSNEWFNNSYWFWIRGPLIAWALSPAIGSVLHLWLKALGQWRLVNIIPAEVILLWKHLCKKKITYF